MSHRTWFITGVSSGFGRQLTDQILKHGERVVGTVRNTAKINDLIERYPEMFHAEVLDVTDTAAIREVVERSFARLASKASWSRSPRRSHPSRSANFRCSWLVARSPSSWC
jgi:NADP-dependent 3-hydroxy acid dehydrogenase YdfG